jgi:hypothetical protein
MSSSLEVGIFTTTRRRLFVSDGDDHHHIISSVVIVGIQVCCISGCSDFFDCSGGVSTRSLSEYN